MDLLRNKSVGEIVSVFPAAHEIFMEYKIDFCCGGKKMLTEAVKEKDLDVEEIIAKLESLYSKRQNSLRDRKDFADMELGELTNYIIDVHHVYLKKALPDISALINTIMRVHGKNHSELFKVHKLYSMLKAELEGHLVKEEEMLFPLIYKYEEDKDKTNIVKALEIIKELEAEHETGGEVLSALRNTTSDYTVPKDGCNTYFVTYEELKKLEADLFFHIHLENNILFKRMEEIV